MGLKFVKFINEFGPKYYIYYFFEYCEMNAER